MIDLKTHGWLVGLIILVGFAGQAAAFGAGNIASVSKVEGQNWRHGDIEDALLSLAMARAMNGKKFNKIMVSRVYFGNWLRDYSQAIDVGTVKAVSAEAIRLLLCVLGFLTFGYGSGEFEVTAQRLGCYRPEDHIDNPKDYADNKDARQYDKRLRGPIDERKELSIDPETGMKNYIANERAGIMTSAKHVRKLLGDCIMLARRYKERDDKADLYESLRLMGTGLHCLEDFFAHSNYCELALIEMGIRDVFPHVGRRTTMRLDGARNEVYPIVTGTFGGVDFLHSVTGEVSDKLTQNEIDELEGTLKDSKNADTSLLRELLDKIPSGLFGNKDQKQKIDEIQSNAANAQMQNTSVSPRNPEEFTRYIQQVFKQVMPAIELHDDIMKGITSAVEKIPVLPKIIEQLEEQLSIFVFSIIAPFIVPLIHQIRNELRTGSDEIIESSEREQHVVFENDNCTDPTHSMLSKDHFSNILNEVAGRTAAKVLHWVVPQIMDAIDDDRTDVDRLLDRVIHGVMHHPAQRDQGQDGVKEARHLIFDSVKEWWGDMDERQRQDYTRKLSRDGVFKGENHKEGVHDTGHGHGCSGKLKMRKLYGEPETLESKIAGKAADAIFSGATGVISGLVEEKTGYKLPSGDRRQEEKEEHHSGLGGLLGKASSLLGGAFGEDEKERETSHRRNDDGSHTRVDTEYGRHGDKYAQAEHRQTQHPDGRQTSETRRYEQQDSQDGRNTSGYGYEERTETRPTHGGYEQHTERREHSGSTHHGNSRHEESSYGSGGGYGGSSQRREEQSYGGGYGGSGRREDSNYGGDSGYGGSQRREDSYGSGGYGGSQRREDSYGSGGYGGSQRREESNYGSGGYGGGGGGYGGDSRRGESDYGRQGGRSEGGYGDSYSQGGGGYGGQGERRDEGGYGRQDQGGYGRQDQDNYGREDQGGYGREGQGGGRRDEYDERRGQDRRDGGGYGGGYGGGGY